MIKDYVHAPDRHEGFVLASFCQQTGEPDSVLRDLIRGGATIKVDETSKQRADGKYICTGWAGRDGDELIYCYVKHDLRELPVLPQLISALGFDLKAYIPVKFFTRHIRAIARHWGYQLGPVRGPDQTVEKGA